MHQFLSTLDQSNNPCSISLSAPQETTGVIKLNLTNFRNYKNLRIETSIAPVVLYGANGSGKTNILEALSFLVPGRGLRRAKLLECQNNTAQNIDKKFWAISAEVISENQYFKIGTGCEFDNDTSERRVIKIDDKIVKGQNDLGKIISAVWLTPAMDRIFSGSPANRRQFLDRLVYAYDHEHSARISAYENAHRQWLTLLKSGKNDPIWLKSLEKTIAEKAVAIAAGRKETVFRLNQMMQTVNNSFPKAELHLIGNIESMIETMPAIEAEDRFRESLVKSRSNDDFAFNGAHRSDFSALYHKNSQPAELCSTGEQKALLISIIFAHAKSIQIALNRLPILLLDEITAHLDPKIRTALFSEIKSLKLQAWLTGTDFTTFGEMQGYSQFLKVENGNIF